MAPTDGACHLNLACTDVVFDSMRGGDAAEKARRAVATALATDLAPDAVDGLRESLVAADADGDGRVSVDDLRNALRKAGSTATAKLVAKLLAGQASGGGGGGGIEYDTLLGATRRMASIVPTTAARAA
jgi:Ca2+-binding EF-hand superfamily protein